MGQEVAGLDAERPAQGRQIARARKSPGLQVMPDVGRSELRIAVEKARNFLSGFPQRPALFVEFGLQPACEDHLR
jgi:hypothetical protein